MLSQWKATQKLILLFSCVLVLSACNIDDSLIAVSEVGTELEQEAASSNTLIATELVDSQMLQTDEYSPAKVLTIQINQVRVPATTSIWDNNLTGKVEIIDIDPESTAEDMYTVATLGDVLEIVLPPESIPIELSVRFSQNIGEGLIPLGDGESIICPSLGSPCSYNRELENITVILPADQEAVFGVIDLIYHTAGMPGDGAGLNVASYAFNLAG